MQNIIDFIKQYISNNTFLVILGILTAYQFFYLVVGFFSKKKIFKDTTKINKYGIVIAARNEELVIGKLIDSLKKQTYDKNKITIFVVADNCNDKTAKVAKEHGAIVYERFDESKKRKGWALQYLFKQIEKDYGILSFDGFIFFDADNLVDKNFVKEINKAFVENGDVVSGYRNVKNFDTNLVSSAYGIHFYRSIVSYHRPRQKLNLGTHIAGTGYVINSKHLKDGYNYSSLTEDAEMTLDLSSKGIKIGFCEDAIFYDEQPTSFKTAFTQRKRWTKGRFDVFSMSFIKVIFNCIKRFSFTLYDLFFYNFPWPFYSLIKTLIYPIILGFISENIYTGVFWSDLLKVLAAMFVGLYLQNFVFGLFTVIRERKNIHTTIKNKVVAIFTYPWFNMITIFLALSILVAPKVTWKEITHDDTRSIEEVKL